MKPQYCRILTPRMHLNNWASGSRANALPKLLVLLFVLLLLPLMAAHSGGHRIAAASSLQFALNELLAAFDAERQRLQKPVYGASGNLYRQIRQGAPYRIFLSADPTLATRLREAGLVSTQPLTFGYGRLALFAASQSTIPLDERGEGLRAAVAAETVFRFAIANPRHAPYGKAALQALDQLKLTALLQSRLVYGEKVSQAAMMVHSGAAELGIISLSLALSPVLSEAGDYVVLPEQLHTPIPLQAVVIGEPDATTTAFVEFLQSRIAHEVLARYGLR